MTRVEQLLSDIPDIFYDVMANEVSTKCVTHKESNLSYYELDPGTNIWCQALKESCKKLNMMWLLERYEELMWQESDDFDYEVARKVVESALNGGEMTWVLDLSSSTNWANELKKKRFEFEREYYRTPHLYVHHRFMARCYEMFPDATYVCNSAMDGEVTRLYGYPVEIKDGVCDGIIVLKGVYGD